MLDWHAPKKDGGYWVLFVVYLYFSILFLLGLVGQRRERELGMTGGTVPLDRTEALPLQKQALVFRQVICKPHG
jgi:hypothetical protein